MGNAIYYPVGGNVNWYNHKVRLYGESSEFWKVDLSYNPAIPLLGIYANEVKSPYEIVICAATCTISQFTIVKIQNQLRCPSTDDWTSKLWDICTKRYDLSK